MNRNIAKLAECGQSVWIDYISRGMIRRGELRVLLDDGVVGLTSNPTIFQKAIVETQDYASAFDGLVHEGKSAVEIYEALVFEDIRAAADQMMPAYHRTDRSDGFVSIEVSPALAYDTSRTLAEGRRIFHAIGRPNVMIKVPGTTEGLPAIEGLLSEGINVNVTLIFSVEVYRQVMRAYLRGLKSWMDSGRDPREVASVASFFVSRIDTMVDQQLEKRIASGEKAAEALLGQAAIANAKMAYAAYRETFESGTGDFAGLAARGGRAQRALWASTSTKNPRFRETYYVDTLIGPNTVNTMPPNTLAAVCRGLDLASTLDRDVDQALTTLQNLAAMGIDMQIVTRDLRTAGVKSFADSFDALMKDIETKRQLLEMPAR